MMLTTTPVTASLHKPSSYNPSRYRWSVRELERMEKKAIFHPETRLELIDGELLNMAPIGYFHAGMVSILTHVLTRGVEDRAIVSVQNPLILGTHSAPQPDLALLRPVPDYYTQRHPNAADVLLLVEISDSTVQFDRKVKVPLYAKHAIPEVWLVLGPQRRRIEIYRDPQAELGSYQTHFQLRDGILSPLLLPQLQIALSALFV